MSTWDPDRQPSAYDPPQLQADWYQRQRREIEQRYKRPGGCMRALSVGVLLLFGVVVPLLMVPVVDGGWFLFLLALIDGAVIGWALRGHVDRKVRELERMHELANEGLINRPPPDRFYDWLRLRRGEERDRLRRIEGQVTDRTGRQALTVDELRADLARRRALPHVDEGPAEESERDEGPRA